LGRPAFAETQLYRFRNIVCHIDSRVKGYQSLLGDSRRSDFSDKTRLQRLFQEIGISDVFIKNRSLGGFCFQE